MEITASSFSSQFIQILDELGKRIGVAIDWTSTNITPYLTDLISRYTKFIIFEKGSYFIISLILLISGSFLTFKYLKPSLKCCYNSEFENSDDLYKMALWIFGLFALFIGILSFSFNLPNFIKSLYIPEYYILNSIKELI